MAYRVRAKAIEKARAKGDLQWVLQLVDRLIHADQGAVSARQTKAALLKERAVDQINCPTRHYYLQCAKELKLGEQD